MRKPAITSRWQEPLGPPEMPDRMLQVLSRLDLVRTADYGRRRCLMCSSRAVGTVMRERGGAPFAAAIACACRCGSAQSGGCVVISTAHVCLLPEQCSRATGLSRIRPFVGTISRPRRIPKP